MLIFIYVGCSLLGKFFSKNPKKSFWNRYFFWHKKNMFICKKNCFLSFLIFTFFRFTFWWFPEIFMKITKNTLKKLCEKLWRFLFKVGNDRCFESIRVYRWFLLLFILIKFVHSLGKLNFYLKRAFIEKLMGTWHLKVPVNGKKRGKIELYSVIIKKSC